VSALREELERHASESFSLVKWKLVVVSAFVVTGLGWNLGRVEPPSPEARLLILYSAGYLCAYIDSLFYRRGTATHAIAAAIRNRISDAAVASVDADYEAFVERLRQRGLYFLSDHILQFVSSLVFTIGSAALAWGAYRDTALDRWWWLAVPTVAVVLNVLMFVLYARRRGALRALDEQHGAPN
jgi:hypothetical protein